MNTTIMIATTNLTLNEIKSHLIETRYIIPTAQTYQSIETSSKGFSTYGPNGISLKNKIINIWRSIFIKDNVYEIDTPILQSQEVLTNSGHVGRFNDLVISNESNEIYRADHLVKKYAEENNIILEKPIDDFTKDELLEFVKKYKVIENSENAIIAPKNLMFGCGKLYLRPEIAQGMFTEFEQFYNYSYDLPFGLAQVGKSFRNEISCQPFIRLKEFTQAEIEYFFDPNCETHDNFHQVKNIKLQLFTQQLQLAGKEPITISLEEAVNTGIIINEIMGYFLGKVFEFVKKLGIDDHNIRFRQHLPNELSHYARQCWDLELLLVNMQWLECVGCAHRGDYDLTNHNIREQNYIKKYDTKVTKYKINLDKKTNLSKEEIKDFYVFAKGKIFNSIEEIETLQINEKYKSQMVITEVQEIIKSKVIPYVIEPSIGIDRIIFALANNLLRKRDADLDRVVFNLKSYLSPYNVGLFVLSNNEELLKKCKQIRHMLEIKYNVYTDFSATSIGKRYVRSDEIGIQYVITIDFETIENNTVTIRNSFDGSQERHNINNLMMIIKFMNR